MILRCLAMTVPTLGACCRIQPTRMVENADSRPPEVFVSRGLQVHSVVFSSGDHQRFAGSSSSGLKGDSDVVGADRSETSLPISRRHRGAKRLRATNSARANPVWARGTIAGRRS